MVGISIIGGLTPFCAAQEKDYEVNIKTGEELFDYKKLKEFEQVKYQIKPNKNKNKYNNIKSKKTPFILSKSLNRISKVNYDIETQQGNVIVNISYLNKTQLNESLDIFKKMYKDYPKYINPYFKLVEHPTNKDKIGLATVCSSTIDGILINNGILCTPQYGGLLELGKPPLFIEMISYNGSSIDPHKIFIFKNLFNISKKQGPKKILASIKEVPYIARPNSEEILNKITEQHFSVLKIGKPRELVYNAKVDNYNFGIVAGSGLNSIAAIKENEIEIEVKAIESIMPLEDMDLIFHQ